MFFPLLSLIVLLGHFSECIIAGPFSQLFGEPFQCAESGFISGDLSLMGV